MVLPEQNHEWQTWLTMDSILRIANCQPGCTFQCVGTAAIVDLQASVAPLGRRGGLPLRIRKLAPAVDQLPPQETKPLVEIHFHFSAARNGCGDLYV